MWARAAAVVQLRGDRGIARPRRRVRRALGAQLPGLRLRRVELADARGVRAQNPRGSHYRAGWNRRLFAALAVGPGRPAVGATVPPRKRRSSPAGAVVPADGPLPQSRDGHEALVESPRFRPRVLWPATA